MPPDPRLAALNTAFRQNVLHDEESLGLLLRDAADLAGLPDEVRATAREAGCGAILSEDFQDGQVLDGVRFLDPFKPANAAQLDRVLS